jgi:hypothetical protein
MKLLSSPRMRRRLGWLTTGLVFAGCVGLLIVLLPGRSNTAEEPTAATGGYQPPEPEQKVTRSRGQLNAPLTVAAKFIETAVARNHVGNSWEILSPTYDGKSGYTKTSWARGDIPVQSFPVDKARWDLDHSFKNEVGLLVALFPPRGSEYRATVFKIDLRAFGKGKSRRWLVDYFGPAGMGNINVEGRGAAPTNRATGLPNLDPKVTGGSSQLDRRWIAVPIGILGLAVLLPIALVVTNMIRVRRAERDFAGTGRA